jgi:O-antigen chain-terminating methyltransferase
VSNFKSYKKAYVKYKIKNIVKYIPFAGSLLRDKILNDAMYDLRDYVNARTNELQAHIDAIKHEQFRQNEYIKKLYGIKDSIMTAISENNTKLSDYILQTDNELNKLTARTDSLTSRTDSLTSRTDSLTARTDSLTARTDSLTSRTDDLTAKTDDTRSKLYDYLSYQWQEIPKVYETFGVLNIPSYLNKAMENADPLFLNGTSDTDKFYYLLQNCFRGSEESLREVFANYLGDITNAVEKTRGEVIDLGCGKGDFLLYLKDNGINGTGVDLNETSLNSAKAKGLTVRKSDITEYVKELPAEKAAVISLIEVAEHLPFEVLFGLIKEIPPKLAPNGIFLLETINPWFGQYGSFHIDPSHIFMPSPEPMKLLFEMFGLTDVKIMLYSPKAAGSRDTNMPGNYQGYCIVGRKTVQIQ